MCLFNNVKKSKTKIYDEIWSKTKKYIKMYDQNVNWDYKIGSETCDT